LTVIAVCEEVLHKNRVGFLEGLEQRAGWDQGDASFFQNLRIELGDEVIIQNKKEAKRRVGEAGLEQRVIVVFGQLRPWRRIDKQPSDAGFVGPDRLGQVFEIDIICRMT
jgi:hypothetical protein